MTASEHSAPLDRYTPSPNLGILLPVANLSVLVRLKLISLLMLQTCAM